MKKYIMQSKTMKKFKKLFSFALALVVAASILPADLAKAADTAPIGIDVSWKDGTIDWAQASTEVDFAVIRATEGTEADDEFANNADGCTANGVPFGVSVYTLAQSAADATAEAEAAVALLDGYTVDLPIYMEFEDAELYALTDAEKLAVVTAFVDAITAAGYEAGLYATMDTYNAFFASNSYYSTLNIWVSDLDATSLPLASANMWQYTWDGTVAGVGENASLNYFYGELPVEEHTHTVVTDAAVAPGCETTGLTEGSHCSSCGEVLVAQEEVPATGHTEVTDAAVAPGCDTTGLTEGSHCSVCGTTIVAQEVVSAAGHTPETDAAVAPTCTATGLTEGSHCSVCGDTILAQEVVAATGHTEGEPVIENVVSRTSFERVVYCSVCGEELSRETMKMVKVQGITLKLEADISIVFSTKTTLTTGYYDSVYAVIVQDMGDGQTKEQTVEGVLNADGTKYEYVYTGVNACELGDAITIKTYARRGDEVFEGAVTEYAGIMSYVTSSLGKTSTQLGLTTGQTTAFKTLLVDLVNYATAAQQYFNYKTDTYVNTMLTADQLALASPDSVLEEGMENLQTTKYETIDSPTAKFTGVTILLESRTNVRLKVKYTGDISNLKVVATVGTEDPIELTEFESAGTTDTYYVYFDEIRASQMEEPLYFKVVEGDTVISNTLRYSVGTYASTALTSNIGYVVSAMMKYGKAAVAFNNAN